MDGEDLKRIEREYTDPRALTEAAIQADLAEGDGDTEGMSGPSLTAAAEGIAERRTEAREQAEDLLDNRLDTSGNATMVRDSNGRFAASAANVRGGDLDVSSEGEVSVPTADGELIELGSIDLPPGAF